MAQIGARKRFRSGKAAAASFAGVQSVQSSHDGAPVAFHSSGSGKPSLVFIPGLTGDHTDFRFQTKHFSQEHHVVTVELPGNGVAATDRTEWSMAVFGADVATVVEHLDLDNVVLIGHSLGGDAAVAAAVMLGDRVSGVVMISSYRSLGQPRSEESDAAWLAPFRTDFPRAMEDLTRRNFGSNAEPSMVNTTVQRMVAADPDIVVAVLESKVSNEPALIAAIEHLNIPVFAVNPDFKSNDEKSLRRHGVTLEVVDGVGHYTMMEGPLVFNEVLGTILQDLT